MNEVVVDLERWEIDFAGYVAFQRVVGNLLNRAQQKYGAETPWGGYEFHFPGLLGELATARWLNMAWTGGWGDYRKIDVGGCVNVRAKNAEHHHLLLHPEDKTSIPVVSATVNSENLARVVLSGWIVGQDGTKEEHWGDKAHNNRPCYWVPPRLLRPMAELIPDRSRAQVPGRSRAQARVAFD